MEDLGQTPSSPSYSLLSFFSIFLSFHPLFPSFLCFSFTFLLSNFISLLLDVLSVSLSKLSIYLISFPFPFSLSLFYFSILITCCNSRLLCFKTSLEWDLGTAQNATNFLQSKFPTIWIFGLSSTPLLLAYSSHFFPFSVPFLHSLAHCAWIFIWFALSLHILLPIIYEISG